MKILWWLAANLVVLLGLPSLAFWVLDRQLIAAHRTDPHLSSQGDSPMIPLVGVIICTLIRLLVGNAIGVLMWWIRTRRHH